MDTTSTPDPRLQRARCLLDEADHTLDALGAAVGLSPAHLQRRFRAEFGLSPAEYRAQKKLATLKRELRANGDVTRAVYEAGYGSSSRVYEDGAARLGMLPGTYRRGGEGMLIHWTILATELGLALVAATERGLCSITLGDDADELEAGLRREFPRAQISRVHDGRDEFLAPRVQQVAHLLSGRSGKLDIELIGTAFQQRVWEALMKIPRGQTLSYAQLAQSLGRPTAARAVARACAQNRLAVIVPCHRIVRGDGSLGGYRWGLPRKAALLKTESASSASRDHR
ncbi:MAG: methylated-DNA--[protein]-cysteine S-methyltransferase [Arenimonas sp.]|jgi:AraC family transcriptional regulator of adaptative response/methylated-DNA-[protein]-cysteine methyltransferase